ncbi:MAG: hypothetical protein ACR2K3_13930 [Nocardioides sp.]
MARHEEEQAVEDTSAEQDAAARERFGGLNAGAAFFGWLVALGVAALLGSIIGAVATGVGVNNNLSQSDAQRQAGTIGIAAAIVLLVVLLIAYYAGGYVAGRMSRYDGGRQGFGVWLIGLLVTILAVVAGWIFGSAYNIFSRVNLPNVPLSTRDASIGAIITALAVLLVTLLAAVSGGKVGRRYHAKVDRVRGY